MNTAALSPNTPVLVGAGQIVERDATGSSPMLLAARAAALALADTGSQRVAAEIDTVCITRLFSDMSALWHCPWGRSDNPPESVARAIGAHPQHRIYSQSGGHGPQSQLLEFARDIAQGTRAAVLLAGAEALKNQRHAERNGQALDWHEHCAVPLEDRGPGGSVATRQEIKTGLNNVAYYYALIEQAQRHSKQRSVAEHQQAMANLLASFSAVAARNPYAQFAGQQSAQEILAAPAMTHLYSKRMIAQDSVNQGAALLLCSLAKAREMGISESRYVYLHGIAQGCEPALSHRPDPALSPVANRVTDRALDIAGLTIDDIELIDIYSCFPCAIVAVADHLGLPLDGSRALTLTGGLPFFGGPGNNYSMHALAEAVAQTRRNRGSYALVTSNGGVLSKHASGVYSCQPSSTDWATTATTINTEDLPSRKVCSDPGRGTIVSYTVHHEAKGGAHAVILGTTPAGEHFVAITAEHDTVTAKSMLAQDPTGMTVQVAPPANEKLHFLLMNG